MPLKLTMLLLLGELCRAGSSFANGAADPGSESPFGVFIPILGGMTFISLITTLTQSAFYSIVNDPSFSRGTGEWRLPPCFSLLAM